MEAEKIQRTVALYGAEAAARFAGRRVILLGVGGVGGFAAECLIRAGVEKLTIVDGDRVEKSNFNRQLVASDPALGEFKAEVICRRGREINPAGDFRPVNRFITSDEAEKLVSDFDLIVDCIDDTPVKCALIVAAKQLDIAIVSSMGAAGKLDPTAVEIADLARTYNCPLAKSLRQKLRREGIERGVTVVFSREKRQQKEQTGIGLPSAAPVVGAFGCAVAAAALKILAAE